MKPFKNKKELERFLLKKCTNAVEKTQDDVYRIVKDLTVAFYKDYTPIPVDEGGYERTYQLHGEKNENFIVRDFKSANNECEASVKLDVKSVEYTTGKRPSGKQVIDTAAQGLHGVSDGAGWKYVHGDVGVKIWDSQFQNEAMDMLAYQLSKELPIKK